MRLAALLALALALVVAALGCTGRTTPLLPGDLGPIPPIELADVTLVWPLVTVADKRASGFITAGTSATHGALFPRDAFDTTPALTRVDEPDVIYDNLVVVGARLDPCFQEGVDAACEASVRLVLQPILPSPADPSTDEARDASVHAFYVVDDVREIHDAIAAVARLRAHAGLDASGQLDVNPLLLDEDGRKAVREVLLRLVGAERLVRVTSMQVHAGNQAWTFGAFVVDEIGSFANPDQVFVQHVLSTGENGAVHVSIDPPIGGTGDADDYGVLLDDDDAAAATLAQRQSAFDAAARIESPRLNNTGTRDCVSCHVTAIVRATASARETLAESPDAFHSDRYVTTTPTDFTDTQLIHNLGYRFDILTLSQRLVNETATTAALADDALHP